MSTKNKKKSQPPGRDREIVHLKKRIDELEQEIRWAIGEIHNMKLDAGYPMP